MKFEFCSRFRNRNRNPYCGQFEIKTTQTANDKQRALDPVCLATPMISWTGGFTISGIVTNSSVINEKRSEFVISCSSVPIQCTVMDFLSGCILISGTNNLRILSSISTNTNILKIYCYPNITLTIGQTVTIIDYTDFTIMDVRAPLNYDVGKFKILYNETLNQYLEITNCCLDTRRLSFTQTTAVGWLPTHNFNIRDALPSFITTITSSTTNSITIPITLNSNSIGDWIRLRLTDYSNQDANNSWCVRITSIVGNTLNFFPNLNVAPPLLSVVEILTFSYDNINPMQYYEQYTFEEYDITLEALSLPNVPIYNSNLSSIPYLYVSLYNVDSSNSLKNLINTNNIHVQESMWIAKLDPNSLKNKNLRFINLDTKQNPQTLILDMKSPQILEILLPNGTIFRTLQNDTISPRPTWPDLNISALFSFSKKL